MKKIVFLESFCGKQRLEAPFPPLIDRPFAKGWESVKFRQIVEVSVLQLSVGNDRIQTLVDGAKNKDPAGMAWIYSGATRRFHPASSSVKLDGADPIATLENSQ